MFAFFKSQDRKVYKLIDNRDVDAKFRQDQRQIQKRMYCFWQLKSLNAVFTAAIDEAINIHDPANLESCIKKQNFFNFC